MSVVVQAYQQLQDQARSNGKPFVVLDLFDVSMDIIKRQDLPQWFIDKEDEWPEYHVFSVNVEGQQYVVKHRYAMAGTSFHAVQINGFLTLCDVRFSLHAATI